MASFWVPLDLDGNPSTEWKDLQSETELTDERHCTNCGHEWEAQS